MFYSLYSLSPFLRRGGVLRAACLNGLRTGLIKSPIDAYSLTHLLVRATSTRCSAPRNYSTDPSPAHLRGEAALSSPWLASLLSIAIIAYLPHATSSQKQSAYIFIHVLLFTTSFTICPHTFRTLPNSYSLRKRLMDNLGISLGL